MSDENKIEEWIPDVEEYNLDNKYKFKCLLEYFVTHLEYIINEDANFVGYEKYLKSLVETNVFKEAGQGHKGHNIQKQIERWNNYNGNVICINIYASNPQSKATYLNWKSSWYNVRAEFKNEHVDSLYITEEEHKDAKSELKYSVDKLGLFSGLSTNEFNEFFDKYMSYMNVNQTTNNNNNKYQEYIGILEANKNLILTGAPGTGKTFLAKQIAARIIYGDNVPEEFENDIAFETQCKLVQFHPSYDYTDFVEGLRPVEKDGNIGFERKDGVFKEFCIRAISLQTADNIQRESDDESHKTTNNSQRASDDEINKAIETFKVDLKSKGNIKLVSFRDNSDDEFIFSLNKKNTICVKNKQDHPMSNKKILKYISKGDYAKKDTYTPTIGNYIKENYLNKNMDNYSFSLNNNFSKKNFIFIIDEINRGEISKIFGELFYCIDPGYRGTQGRISTQYQNLVPKGDVFEPTFYVPDNVYIIGTMNDIDRSVESMDFAFRRRFAFMEVKADENLEMLYEVLDENLADKSKLRLLNLNKKISEMEDEGLSSAYHIGASYFLKIKDYNGDFEKLWNYHLIGLLREYLRGMSNIEAKIESLKAAYDNESASNN